jgi:peptide/nickel transport system ATP-binding protein
MSTIAATTHQPAPGDAVLAVRDLSVRFGDKVVVDRVSFTLRAGQCAGLVGASGSGKSVASLALMGLMDPSQATVQGSAMLQKDGGEVDLLALDPVAMRHHCGRDLAMVFQEPMTALDPVYTVGEQVAEALRHHLGMGRAQARDHVIGLFHEVLLPEPETLYHRYPHQLSGGQKQRVVIAMALSCSPRVLICDEPTTALDVLVQRDVLDLLKALQRKRGMAMLFITHDLGVVREVADEVLVMRHGRVVEQAPAEVLFTAPQHPYTRGLIACRPDPHRHPQRLTTVEDLLATGGAAPEVDEVTTAQRAGRLAGLLAREPLLRVEALHKEWPVRGGPFAGNKPPVTVLHDLSFAIYPGETLGVVGGSGSGKTTLGRSILRLIEPTSGRVHYNGYELTALDSESLRRLRRELQIVFQDPWSALNPRMAVGRAIAEAMAVHGIGTSDTDRRERVGALLEQVGLEKAHYDRFPHQFSGGQRQRVVIARAIALRPKLIVLDESVAALDVSVQAQVLNLLNDLKEEHGLTYLFISHDLNVVKYFCDRVLVLERGHAVELGPADRVYEAPEAEYTRSLVEAIPSRAHR